MFSFARRERTTYGWISRSSDDLLRQLYDLMKYGPTSANSCPARILFLRTPRSQAAAAAGAEPDQRREDHAGAGDRHHRLRSSNSSSRRPNCSRTIPAMRDNFATSPQLAEITAFRNGSLQGGYLILAARSLGLDCGPMSGFDNAKVDAEFFSATAGNPPAFIEVKSNFLCNLGLWRRVQALPAQPAPGLR